MRRRWRRQQQQRFRRRADHQGNGVAVAGGFTNTIVIVDGKSDRVHVSDLRYGIGDGLRAIRQR
jgi:hypothetical protein